MANQNSKIDLSDLTVDSIQQQNKPEEQNKKFDLSDLIEKGKGLVTNIIPTENKGSSIDLSDLQAEASNQIEENIKPEEPMQEPLPTFEIDQRTSTVRDLDPTKKVDYMGLWKTTRLPSQALRKIAQDLIDKLPDPESKSVVVNFALGSPKALAEILADVGSGYATPEALALFGLGKYAPMLAESPVAKEGIKKIGALVPDQVKKFMFYRFKQPEEYVKLAEGMIRNIKQGMQKVSSIGKGMFKLNEPERVLAAQYLKGEIGASGLSDDLLKVAQEARDEFVTLGKDAVDLGLLPKDVYEANLKTYLPRFYSSKEPTEKLGGIIFPKKPIRVDLSRFKKRGDIPENVREAMGEIIEAGYPTVKGLSQLRHAVETQRLFKNVSINPEWSTPSAEIAAKLGFTKLPEVKSLGSLSGKYVHPYIADDINQIIRPRTNFEKIWNPLISKWKYGKVVLNPATHFRNMLSNSILADMGGLNHLQQIRLMPKALKEIFKKGKLYNELKDEGVIGVEFVGGEIKNLMKSFAGEKGPLIERISKISGRVGDAMMKFRNNVRGASEFLGKVYQGEEQLYKMMKYIRNRELGMDVKAAAADAEKWLFNYEKVSPFIDKVRQSPLGSPFITFTSKALPRIAETAVTNPLKLYKYKLLFDSIENRAQKSLNLSDDEIQTIKKNSRGQVLILPFRDKEGSVMTLDLSYILPWGDIGEVGGIELAGAKLPPVAPPSGPIKSIIELGFNKNTFSGRPIYNDYDFPSEKVQKSIDHIARTILPSLTPGGIEEDSLIKGGYSFSKIVKAIQKRPDYFGRVRGLPVVLADTILGIKLIPADPTLMKSLEISKKRGQIMDLQRDMRAKMRNQSLSEDYKMKLMDKYPEKLNRILGINEKEGTK